MAYGKQRGQVEHVKPRLSVGERAVCADLPQRPVDLLLEFPELSLKDPGGQPFDAVEVPAVRNVVGLGLEGLRLIDGDDEQLRLFWRRSA